VLYLYDAAYRDAFLTDDARLLAFPAYSGAGLFVRAEWQGALIGGVAQQWAMSLKNDGSRPQTLESLKISLQPLTPTGEAFSYAGDAVVVAEQSFGNVVLQPGAVHETNVSFALAGTGWTSLDIEVDSHDDVQPYRNARDFVVDFP
jgi:hypothetical protein